MNTHQIILLLFILGIIIAYILFRKSPNIRTRNRTRNTNIVKPFILPLAPPVDAPLDTKIEWILYCDTELGGSLGVTEVFQWLHPDAISSNMELIRKMASTYNKLLQLGTKEKPLEEFGLTLLEEMPASPQKDIICYLWKFYCASFNLVVKDAKLRDWINNQEIPTNPTTIQLYYILLFSFNSFNISIKNMASHLSNPIADDMVNKMINLMLNNERDIQN